MTEYLPILIALLFAVAFVVAVIVVSTLVVPMRPSPSKNSPYESGVDPVGDARQRFHVRFYLVAVLFILFDIEAVKFFT